MSLETRIRALESVAGAKTCERELSNEERARRFLELRARVEGGIAREDERERFAQASEILEAARQRRVKMVG